MNSQQDATAMTLQWVDLDREVIDVDGADALAFLHSQLANDVSQMAIGETVHSLLLEPTGHVVALVRVVRHGESHLTIDVERGYGDIVIKRLSKFVLRAKVSMTLGHKVVRAFRGENAQAIAASMALSPCVLAHPWWDDHNAIDVIAEIDALPSLGTRADPDAIDAVRVDAGWPRMGIDIHDGDIPAATGVVHRAVSFVKGCYPGQELVERMDSRGTMAPVVLRVFSIEDDVSDGDVSDGDVTSRGVKHKFARVKRSDVRGDELDSLWQ
jgi:folate-binding protein YgfZ